MLAHAALAAARNIPLFVIVAVPAGAEAIQDWLARCSRMEVAGWLRAGRPRKFNRLAADTADTDSMGRFHCGSLAEPGVVAAIVLRAPSA